MAPKGIHVQFGRDDDPRPLVVLPPGAVLPASLSEDAVVVIAGRDGYEVQLPGESERRLIDLDEWTPAIGWMLRGTSPPADDTGLRDDTDWGAPEIRVIAQKGSGARPKMRLASDDGEELIVGRKDCDLVIDDTRVSRQHLRILRERGRYYVEDLWSKGGTFVNGDKINSKRLLRHKDRIQVGGTLLQYYSLFDALDQSRGDAQDSQVGATDGPENDTQPRPATKGSAEKVSENAQPKAKVHSRKPRRPAGQEPEPQVAEESAGALEVGAATPSRPWWENAVLIIFLLVLAAVIFVGYRQFTGGGE